MISRLLKYDHLFTHKHIDLYRKEGSIWYSGSRIMATNIKYTHISHWLVIQDRPSHLSMPILFIVSSVENRITWPVLGGVIRSICFSNRKYSNYQNLIPVDHEFVSQMFLYFLHDIIKSWVLTDSLIWNIISYFWNNILFTAIIIHNSR